MSFDPELLDLMPHTITVQALSSFDSYGDPSYSTAVTSYRALVEEKPTKAINQYGEEVLASHIAYVASTARIDLTSLVTLPDGTAPDLISSGVFADEDGTAHHVVLHFGGGSR